MVIHRFYYHFLFLFLGSDMDLGELLKLTKAAIARQEYGSIVDDKGRPREGNRHGNYHGQHGNSHGQRTVHHGSHRGHNGNYHGRGHHTSNPGNTHFQPGTHTPPLINANPLHMPQGPPRQCGLVGIWFWMPAWRFHTYFQDRNRSKVYP